MTDQNVVETAAVEQLTALTELAHRGRADIVNTGPIMTIWGVAITVAALAEHLSQHQAYTVAAWVLPVLCAYLTSLLSIRASRSDGRAVTWRSRAIYRIWIAAGAAIVIFNVGEELRHAALQSESEAATALILSIAVLATAELANRRILLLAGIGWLAVASAAFMIDGDKVLTLLTYAAITLQIGPGIALIREEWKA